MVALKRALLLNQQSRCLLRASAQNDGRELRRTIDSAGRDFPLLSGNFRGVLLASLNKERKMTNETAVITHTLRNACGKVFDYQTLLPKNN